MNENTVVISKDEYKSILELAYKAAMLKEAVLNCATLDFYGKELYFGGSSDVATIFKYAFPTDYDDRLVELKEKAENGKEGSDNER